MTPLASLTGIAAPMLRDDIDTDQIISVPDMIASIDTDFGASLFAYQRFERDGTPRSGFVLNTPPYDRAQFLVTGANFGCGSSREHAVWALLGFGIRCIVGVSFGEIFAANCQRQGLLLIALPREEIVQVHDALVGGAGAEPMRLDVARQTIGIGALTFRFDIEPGARDRLLAGRDEVDETLSLEELIERFEAQDRSARPWIHRDQRDQWGPDQWGQTPLKDVINGV